MGQDANRVQSDDINSEREWAYKQMLDMLTKSFGPQTKKAGKEYVSQYTLFVVAKMPLIYESIPDVHSQATLLMTHAEPKKWAVLIKILADREWRVVMVPNAYDSMDYMGEPILPLTTRRVLINRPTVLDFYLHAVSELRVTMRQITNSLLEFIYTIDPDPDFIKQLHDALSSQFFPLESVVATQSGQPPEIPLYTILQAAHPTQLSEVAQLMEANDPRANTEGRQQDWASIMDGKQKVFVAYSYEAMRDSAVTGTGPVPILGYMATSSLVSVNPRLISIVVVPDERRRGMATAMLRRYFTQTGCKSLLVSVPKLLQHGKHSEEPYHLCIWLKKMGGILDKNSLNHWRFSVPNLYLNLQK